MKHKIKVTYIHHSAFCVEIEGNVLVFDYYKGDAVPSCAYHGKMPKFPEGTPVYVFSSHSHRDHFDREVLSWSRHYRNIHYIFAKEIKKKLGGSLLGRLGFGEEIQKKITYVRPGEEYEIGGEGSGIHVETLRSTDSGVAFVTTVSGRTIYHAGDLNWWRWEGEPEAFNQAQEKEYKEQIDLLAGRKIDLAFVVLDPRQERDKYLGIDYFVQQVSADYIVPMHLWKHYELIEEYRSLPQNNRIREKILKIEGENQVLELPVPNCR
ncbi:MAG: MBL fold metallo-hydrolase [Lachnospiraceae bacterium]|nr:MBL fold metallo-hydrolase [Lachnospiraceae bacterium]